MSFGGSLRKNEISRLSITVSGRRRDSKDNEKRNFYKIETTELKSKLDALFASPPRFEDSFIDLSERDSLKFQKIGLEKSLHKKEQGLDFYQFRAGYIFREKEDIQKIHIDKKSVHSIRLGDKEYRYSALHFTLVPAYNVAVVDSKCHSRPTAHFLKYTLLKYLTASDYMLGADEIEGKTTFKVSYIPKSDFDHILKTKLNTLREVGIELAKPNAMKMAAYEPSELEADMDFYMKPMGSILNTFFGIDTKKMTLEDVPFKKLRIQFVLDEGVKGKSLNPFRNGFKGFVDDKRTSAYLKDTQVLYKDNSTGEMERAILSGATLADPVTLESIHFDDASKMWKEQRDCFFRNKRSLI